MKPTIKPLLLNGQLEHAVCVNGKPVQTHSTLKAAMCALTLAWALTGCAATGDWIHDHPRTTTAIGAALVVGYVIAHNPKGPAPAPEPRMSAPLTPDCVAYPEMCR